MAVTPHLAAGPSVGTSVPRVEDVDHVHGATRYVADLRVPGTLAGVLVRSTVPHGTIRSIDVSAARRVPGVRAVLTGRDLPEVTFGPYVPDWEILARDKVRFVGDDLVAIAATTEDAAREAAARVRVEVEPLPDVRTPDHALAPDAPVIWGPRPDNVASRFDIARGDVDAAFDRADHMVEGRFSTNRIYHAYLENIGVVAQHRAGAFTLHVPTHIPTKARRTYARALDVPVHRVRVVVPPIGGSFGAKYEMTLPLVAAALARAADAPVRMVYERDEDAAVAHPRPPFVFHHRIAADADGRFLGRTTDIVGDAGARTFWSPTVLATATHRVDSLYHFHTMRGDGRLVYTTTNPTTCMRGFGNAESLFGVEQLIDELAERLGADPVEIRQRNAVHAGDTTLHGWRVDSCALDACLERARTVSGFSARRAGVTGERGVTGVRRGLGVAAGHHVSGYRGILPDFDGSSAIVRIGADGRIALLVGEPDIGQSQSTVLAQLVADQLGCDPGDVEVPRVDSALHPDAVGTLASRATTLAGKATELAAAAARRRLDDFATERGLPTEDLHELAAAWGAAHAGLPVLGEGVYHPPTEAPDDTRYGNPSVAYPFAVHVAEVAVDTDTGQVTVERFWAIHDSGRVVNPETARGQVVGAIAQGVGWILMEDVVLGADGAPANADLLDYRIPAAADVPETIVEFVEEDDPHGPSGAKSLAEAAINPVVAAIANAIHDATGVRVRDLPATPEELWRLLAEVREATA